MGDTIIDSLIVKLGLKKDDYDKKRKEVDKSLDDLGERADGAGKKVSETAKRGTDGFESMGKSAVKFFALLGGAMAVKNFIRDTIESSSALYRLSKNLNENAETISAWSNAAEIMGGSKNGILSALSMISKAQTDIQFTGESPLIPLLSMFSIPLAYEGKARKTTDILLDLADAFSRMEDRRTAVNIGQKFGFDEGTMNLLLQGRDAVEEMIKKQREFNAITDRQAKIWEESRRKLVEWKQELKGLGYRVLEEIHDSTEGMFKGIDEWFSKIKILHIKAVISFLGEKFDLGSNVYFDFADKFQTSVMEWIGGKVKVAIEYYDKKAEEAGFNPPEKETPKIKDRLGNLPRGIRNNNPGNLEYRGQAGAHLESKRTQNNIPTKIEPHGYPEPQKNQNNNPEKIESQAHIEPKRRFAAFDTMREGIAALVRQIGLYLSRGRNTIRKIIEIYSPASENGTINTELYISAVSRALGISSDQPLNMENSEQIKALVRAIATHENSGNYLSDADIEGGYQMAMAARNWGVNQTSNSTQNHIGEVNIHTQASDSNGIAQDMGNSLDFMFTAHATPGLQ